MYFVNSLEYSSCNKLWGVTQDANGKMLYKVGMYMCVEDPYDIYKNAYSSTGPTPLLQNNSLPNPIKSNVSFLLNDTNVTSTTNTTNVTLRSTTNITNTTLSNQYNSTNATLSSSYNATNTTNATEIYNISNATHTVNSTNITLTINSTNISPLSNKNNSENISYPTSLRVSNPKSLDQSEQLKKSDPTTTIIIIVSIVGVNIVILGIIVRIKYKRKVKEDLNKQKKIIQPQQKETVMSRPDLSNRKKTQYVKRNQTKSTKGLNKHNRPHQPPLTVNTTDTKRARDLKLNHTALTPNTQHILDESKKSVQHWYQKTFPKDVKSNRHLPPISRVHPSAHNSTTNSKQSDGRVKELIKQKELSIREIQSGKQPTKNPNGSFAK